MKFSFRKHAHNTYRFTRFLVITIVGTTVLLLGVALIFLPGPAFIFIPLGLGILGLEFPWAKRLYKKIRDKIKAKYPPQHKEDNLEIAPKHKAKPSTDDLGS
ncbi:MAG: PGPGW domain-containing protein [Verrucomicrobia bacterium]|nr:PGPGW domain-containing protein [Verrucomicrobiota bacterium]MCH8510156.1 PGPGW domain-containing protein [Kiritimatiellia bacterium]